MINLSKDKEAASQENFSSPVQYSVDFKDIFSLDNFRPDK